MPKIKVARKDISLDMTAMCDMAFLLLTFFILTTKFKPQEPVAVDIPSSVSEKVIPKDSLIIISFDKNGAVFFSLDNQNQRFELIKLANQTLKLNLTEKEMTTFSTMETFGIPVNELKAFLGKGTDLMKDHPGIPADTIKNELSSWIRIAKSVNPQLRIAIRGDRNSDYSNAKKVIGTLQELNLNRMSFVTSLESKPGN